MDELEPAELNTGAHFVFVSYSHEDEAMVQEEIAWLQDQGVRVWYDRGISIGSEWTEEIATAITQCAAFVYFVTPASAESRNCRNEIQYALEHSKHLIVAHLEQAELPGGLSLTLGLTQALFAHETSQPEFRQRLLAAIESGPQEAQTTGPPLPAARRSTIIRTALTAAAVAILVSIAVLWWRTPDSSAGMNEYWAAQDLLRRWPTEENLSAARSRIDAALRLDTNKAIFHAASCELETTAWRRGYVDTLEPADAACRAADALDSESWQVQLALAYLFYAEGKNEAANSEATAALALAPEQARVHEILGRIRSRLNDHAGAEAAFTRAIELEPQYWSHYEMLGSYLYRQGRYAEAVAPLAAAVDLAPRDAIPTLNNLANAYLMSDELNKAKAIYERTIEIEATSWAYDALGRIHHLRGCPTHAAASFRKGLQVQPRWRIWGALGEACDSVADGARVSRLALQKALEGANQQQGDAPQFQAEVAYYYAMLGETDLAVTTLRQLGALPSIEESTTAYYLAMTSRELDRRVEFEAAVRKAEDLGYPASQLPAWEKPVSRACPDPALAEACTSISDLPL